MRDLRPLPDCLCALAGARLHGMNDSLMRARCNITRRSQLARPAARADRARRRLAACTKTAAQQAPPPPPQVTVANVIERDVTEWDEFTGRLQAVDSVEVRPRVSGFVSAVRFDEGAIVGKATCCSRSIRGRSRPKSIGCAPSSTRARATVQRADSELERAERLRAENAISNEEHDRRAAFAQESAAQVAAVEAALRAAELNLEFTRVTSPIAGRVGRAIVTEGNLVSSGPGEATLLTTVVSLDPVYAYFDADEQIFLKYTAARRRASVAGSIDRRSGWRWPTKRAFRAKGGWTSSTTSSIAATGTIRGRAVFRNADGLLTPGLFVRLRLAGAG